MRCLIYLLFLLSEVRGAFSLGCSNNDTAKILVHGVFLGCSFACIFVEYIDVEVMGHVFQTLVDHARMIIPIYTFLAVHGFQLFHFPANMWVLPVF